MFLVGRIILIIGLLAFGQAKAQVVINEICSANGDIAYDPEFYNFSSWIELRNTAATPVDVSGYYLSDEELVINKWQVPAGTTIAANGYLIIWCDKQNTGWHTNFSLDSDGETVILSNASQALVDKVTFPKQYTNVSYGRVGNGTTIGFLTLPTINDANNSLTGTVQLDNPIVSLTSGRYSTSQSASITHAIPGVIIRYTLDGSEPISTSPVYSNSISITKTLTLKAKAFQENAIPSKAEVKTYFINEHEFSLPVISISTHPDYLFDDLIGMYVEGTNGIIGHCSTVPYNWNQDWDRHAVIEYFDETGDKKFDQGVEIRIGGDCTRPKPQKSFVIKADDKYGRNNINEKLFDNKDAERYGGFMYRNSGNDNNILHFRDALIQHIAGTSMDVDYMDYKPTIHYLNGEYWGIQNMREKIDGDFIESNYGISKDDIDMIEKYKTVIEGTDEAYRDYIETLQLMDMSQPATFSYMDEHIDVQEYINYLVTEIYFCNTDWPGNNMKFWRQRSTNGKFRWILWDTDFGLGFNSNPSTHPTLTYATTPGTSGATSGEATLHIRLALQNPEFKERFIKTLSTAMSSIFSPANFNAEVDTFQNRIKDEMPYHKARWGGTMEDWALYIERVKTWMSERQPFMVQHIADFFSVPQEYVSLNAMAHIPGTGSFYLNNTITSPVVSGPYYKDNSFTIKAVPSTGYIFDHWKITKADIIPFTIATKGDVWKYFDQGSQPASDWTSAAYSDTGWSTGTAELGYGDGDENTIVSYGSDPGNRYITTYFRKTFQLNAADLPGIQDITAAVNFDDGVVVYLNGAEVYRNNMPSGAVTFSTEATSSRSPEDFFNSFIISKELLQAGDNVIAVEVHQSNASSSDLSFDFEASTSVNGPSTEYLSTDIEISDIADMSITMEAFFEAVPPVSGIVINEVNATSTGATDNFGENDDWIELYNTNNTSVDIGGLYLTDDLTQKTKYQIPAGAGATTIIPAQSYKILWADDQIGQGALHVGFKLSAEGESVGLYQAVGDNINMVDEVTFPLQTVGKSYARIPNVTGPFISNVPPSPGSENKMEVFTSLEEEASSSLSIYPNPTADEVQFKSAVLVHEVSVKNMMGGEMQRLQVQSQTGKLNLAALPAGVYILLLNTEKGLKSVKVLKK